MNTILVTGGAGFIGGCFVRQNLVNNDLRVVNLDKLTYAGNLDSLGTLADNTNHVFIQGDINDSETIARLLSQYHPHAIVHFAAETHVDRSIDRPYAFVHANVVGTFRLLEAAYRYWKRLSNPRRERFRFLHVSTDEVYGSLGPTGRFTETTPYAPNSPYSASKAASDHFVRAYHHTYGLPTLVTNCSNNYGPYQFPEKLIPQMIIRAVDRKPLPVYGDGGNVRDWLFVEDHCRALWTVLNRGRPGEVYNIGSNSELTNLQLVQEICKLVDRLHVGSLQKPSSSLITLVEDRPGHDRRYAIDATKICSELGWKPQIDFKIGLETTVRWYLENHPWLGCITSGMHYDQRFGLATAHN